MKSIAFILLSLSLICLMSCSSQEPQNTKPTQRNDQQSTQQSDGSSSEPVESEPVQDEQQISDTSTPSTTSQGGIPTPKLEALSFPISKEARELSASQAMGFDELCKAINSHRRSEGKNPKTIMDFVNSGYPLFWPRNVQTGKPASIFKGKDMASDFSSFGSFQYSMNDENFALVKFIYLSWGRAKDGTEDTWAIQSKGFPAKEVNDLPLIEGCSVPIHKVEDPFARKVLASVGQITGLIVAYEIKRYALTETLLPSFYDLLNPQQLVIRENYEKFVELMKSPDVEFKWGNDYAKESFYLYLKVKGKVYIEQCYYLGGGTELEALMKMKSCSFSELDTSSPILTSENIGQIVIPDEYYISIKDIPEYTPVK